MARSVITCWSVKDWKWQHSRLLNGSVWEHLLQANLCKEESASLTVMNWCL